MGQKSVKYRSSSKFYRDLTKTNTMVGTEESNMCVKVQIRVALEDCSPMTKYKFIAYDISKGERNLGSSESLECDENGKILFNTTFITEYYFEKDQPIKILISIGNNSIIVQTTMGNIIGARNHTFKKKINEKETLLISALELKDNTEYFNINFSVNFPGINWSESKNSFYYEISNRTLLYRSESISNEGKFSPCSIPTNLLTPNFTLSFLNSKKKSISTLSTSLDDFTNINSIYRSIPITLRSGINCTVINQSNKRKVITFMDYLKVGVQLGLTIAIDFTGSNGSPLDKGTLHEIKENEFNDYQRAIYQCGKIVSPYDYDQLFPVYGFGAILPGHHDANMCFNLNFQEDPNIYTIEGVLNEYNQHLTMLNFSGPTFFAPIIKKTLDTIRADNNPFKYEILMILTDGIINDMDKTIDLLVEGSFMPLSVIIVGIGGADFTNMNVLDADDDPLVDKNGRKSGRDLVQFVSFNKFQHDEKKLAEEVLEEVPRQIVEYYIMHNMFPDSFQQ